VDTEEPGGPADTEETDTDETDTDETDTDETDTDETGEAARTDGAGATLT
jgi:hypothetical protein